MGRWGYTMFQGDTDLDVVSEFEAAVGIDLCEEDPTKIKEARDKLDNGLGAQLMQKWRSASQAMNYLQQPEYMICVLAAYMMTMGAKISPEDRKYMQDALPGLPGKNGYVFPLADEAFRAAGKVQFTAALENYVDGQPRSFMIPSCYNCGKTAVDLGGVQLKSCLRCKQQGKRSVYCNKDCQKRNWKEHKVICQPVAENRGGFVMMNV